MSSRILIALLLTTVAAATPAQEARNEGLALELFEAQGRFALYDVSDGEKTPLFVSEDPTTSYFSVLLDNRIYRLGDSFEFRQEATIEESEGTITWTSPRLTVSAEIALESRSRAVVDMELTNSSQTTRSVGLRMLLDTHLGEDAVHFRIPDGEVDREAKYNDIPAYVQSGEESGTTLYLLFDDDAATTPDTVVLANWKRLDDTSWSYTANTNRNFSVIPYSIDDSALAAYYEPVDLDPEDSRRVRIVFATELPASDVGREDTGAESAVGSGAETTAGNGPLSENELRQRILAIERLVSEIDALLDSSSDPSEEELRKLTEQVRSLKQDGDDTQ